MGPITSKTGGVVVPQRLKWHQKLSAALIYFLAHGLMKTWRCRFTDESNLFSGATGPLIFCIWHNRLAWSMVVYHSYVRPRHQAEGLSAMISASKDGGLLTTVLEKFSVQAVRGSTSRRGPQALLEATRWIDKGFHVAITPDGPRGPRYKVQPGIISLAQVAAIPIIPVTAFTRHKLSLRSWDGFQIPWPFARCEIRLGRPVYVPRDASEAARDVLRQELERAMMDFTTD